MRYLLASYYKKPNGKYNESVKTDSKVRDADLRTASVIIDYKERKIVKSTFQGELGEGKHRDFDTINNFYKQHYGNLIAQLEAKYLVLDEALEMAKSIVDDTEAADDAEAAIKEIAKNDIAS